MNCQGRLLASLVTGVFLLSGCGKSHSGWESFPVPLYADPAVVSTAQAQSDFQDAMKFWEQKTGRTLFDYKGVYSGPAPYGGDATRISDISANVIMFVNPWPFPVSAVGETTVISDGSTIHGAVIMINPYTDFCAGDCTGQSMQTSQRRTFTHELGHFLGLNHVQDPTNIMFPTAIPGGSLQGLAVDDRALSALTRDQ